MASAISSVQSGVIVWTSGTTASATLTAVTVAQTIVSFSEDTNTATNMVSRGQVTSSLTSTTNITFTKYEAGDTVNIRWYAVVCDATVAVQRGSYNASTDGAPANITISTVSLTTAYPLLDYRSSGSYLNLNDAFSANVTTTTNLYLDWDADEMSDGTVVNWQVVNHSGCSVQRTSQSLGNATTGSTTITSVTLTSTALWASFTWSGDAGSAPSNFWGFKLATATTVTYFRTAGLADTTVVIGYVVSYTDGTTVQRGEVAVASGSTTSTVAITSVSTTTAYAKTVGVYGRVCACSNTTDPPAPTLTHFSTYISSATVLTWARNGSGSTATYEWEVVSGAAAVAAARTKIIWIPAI